jgi:hypothetical protein
MRAVEPAPATGAYFALQCALASHVGVSDEAAVFARHPFDPPPRFVTMARLTRAFLLLRAGLPEQAAASYQQAGPVQTWSLPAFFILPGYVYGVLVCADLGRSEDLENTDPALGLDFGPLEARSAKIRAVLSNSFAFGGHNFVLAFTRA